jgi:hypothetical protein
MKRFPLCWYVFNIQIMFMLWSYSVFFFYNIWDMIIKMYSVELIVNLYCLCHIFIIIIALIDMCNFYSCKLQFYTFLHYCATLVIALFTSSILNQLHIIIATWLISITNCLQCRKNTFFKKVLGFFSF